MGSAPMSRPNRRETLFGVAAAGAGVLGIVGARAHPHPAPPGSWQSRADMPFPVQEIYPTAFERLVADPRVAKPASVRLLVNAGGMTPTPRGPFAASAVTAIYDPTRDEWRYGPALPQGRHHLAVVTLHGRLYAAGGFASDAEGGWRMRAELWRLDDLNAGVWMPATPLPTPQAEAVAVALNGFLHIVGGRSPATSRNSHWRDHIDVDRHWAYDPRRDEWFERRPVPTPRNSAAGAVLGGLLYVIGGRTVRGGVLPTAEIYDPLSDRWDRIAPLPKSKSRKAPHGQAGLAAAAWNGKIYAMGGEWFDDAGGGVYADMWEYDPRADRWRAVAPMPRPRHGLGAVALDDGIYVCGGATSPGAKGTSAFLDRFTI